MLWIIVSECYLSYINLLLLSCTDIYNPILTMPAIYTTYTAYYVAGYAVPQMVTWIIQILKSTSFCHYHANIIYNQSPSFKQHKMQMCLILTKVKILIPNLYGYYVGHLIQDNRVE